jgi:hypothetical protein
MHCGEAMPRSCECLRQCRAHFCPNKGKCETPRDPWFVRCFERLKAAVPAGSNSSAAAAGPIQILSDIPEEWEDQQGLIKWYRGIRNDLQREIITRPHGVYVSLCTCQHPSYFNCNSWGQSAVKCVHHLAASAAAPPGGSQLMLAGCLHQQQHVINCSLHWIHSRHRQVMEEPCCTCSISVPINMPILLPQVRPLAPGGAGLQALPLSQCPAKCSGRGHCIKSSSVPAKCLCWQGYTGNQCEQVRAWGSL